MATAALSFCVAMAEGYFYYADCENSFFRFLLMLQNSMKAFAFSPSISLDNMVKSLRQDPSGAKTVIGYAYGFAVFLAPFCSAAAVYRGLERATRMVFHFARQGHRKSVVVFGYNEDIRALLDHQQSVGKDREQVIHLVVRESLPQDTQYLLLRQGCRIHETDYLNVSSQSWETLVHRLGAEKIQRIVLFSDSTAENFSVLQRLCPTAGSWLIPDGVNVYFRCEDSGIRYMVEDYYDTHPRRELFDLEFVSIPELQIRNMYRNYPLCRYYETMGDNAPSLDDWAVHLLVLGCGQLGRQAILQAMNLGVFSAENPIRIDVVDWRNDMQSGILSGAFRPEAMNMTSEHFSIQNSCADGSFDIFFHQMDVRCGAFRHLLEVISTDAPINYAVVAMEDPDVSMHCVKELQRYLTQPQQSSIPILLRMDANAQLGDYIRDNRNTFQQVHLIQDRRSILTLQELFRDDVDAYAKEFNHRYASVTLSSAAEKPSHYPAERTAAETWRSLSFFRRDSNRAAATYLQVNSAVLRHLAKVTVPGADLPQVLEQRFSEHGTLLKKSGGVWQYPSSDTALLDAVNSDAFAFAAVKAEHRRWCYYMISIGWKYGEKDDTLRQNPCLVGWAALTQTQPTLCKYDLIPLIVKYEGGENNGTDP